MACDVPNNCMLHRAGYAGHKDDTGNSLGTWRSGSNPRACPSSRRPSFLACVVSASDDVLGAQS